MKHEAPFLVPDHLRSAADVEHFYKYKYIDDSDDEHPDHSRRIFTNNELYFSKVSAFNDPFDCRFRLALGMSQEEQIASIARENSKFLSDHAIANTANTIRDRALDRP